MWPLPIIIGKSYLYPINVGFLFIYLFLLFFFNLTNGNLDRKLATRESEDGLETYFSLGHFRLGGHEACDTNLGGLGHKACAVPATESQQVKRVSHLASLVGEGRNWASIIWKSVGTWVNYVDICPGTADLHL